MKNSYAIRSHIAPSVTDDPEIEEKILEGIKYQSDLCEPKAGHFFCIDNKDIKREKMPQLSGKVTDRFSPIGKFIQMLMVCGTKITNEMVEVCKLKATQNEINGDKVKGFLAYIDAVDGDLTDEKISWITDDNIEPTIRIFIFLSHRYFHYLLLLYISNIIVTKLLTIMVYKNEKL